MISAVFVVVFLSALIANCTAFVPVSPNSGYRAKTQLNMGGKMSKFGIFSPAVYAAKFVLGIDTKSSFYSYAKLFSR